MKKSQNRGNQGFPKFLFLMMEGSGSGSLKPKNIRNLRTRIRIHNTGLLTSFLSSLGTFYSIFIFFLFSCSYCITHPFLSSFSSFSSLFCSVLLPLFPSFYLRFIFFLSVLFSYFDLFTPPELYLLPHTPIKNRHVIVHCNLFAERT
jgi:hypothetical protein